LGGGPLQEQHFDRRTACCAFSSSASITAWRGCIAALSAASSVEASIARGVWGVVSPTRISASAKTSPGPSTSVVLSFRRPLGHFHATRCVSHHRRCDLQSRGCVAVCQPGGAGNIHDLSHNAPLPVPQECPSPARMITGGIREASDMLRHSPEVRCVDE
jgi:hypothetical protein